MLFRKVQGAVAVLRSKGIYRHSDVYSYGERLFAKWGSGFIGLKRHDQGTTIPNVSWEHVEGVEYDFGPAPFGHMLKRKNA